MAAPADGKIVAWTITLGSPGKPRSTSSTTTTAAPRRRGSRSSSPEEAVPHVNGHSPLQRLQPYFGTTVQFPLDRALDVKKGYVVALTVPSWAPALALGHGQRHLVAGEPRDAATATKPGMQSAQLALGNLAQYRCLYRTARLTYSATMITTPKPPKKKS